MLTRLRISGFKNLVDVNVHFGPFTCIAGANGVGKSNLFDVIGFLSALADKPLIEAAMSVRNEGGRTGDIRSLFHRVGEQYDSVMEFDIEMIVPKEGFDDLGQRAKASQTFLRYQLTLAYRADEPSSPGGLEITREDLSYVKRGDTRQHLGFEKSKEWVDSVVTGARRAPFISTADEPEGTVIRVHQDGGSSGKPQSLLAKTLPRTALSAANAAESPTATLARREMQSWKLLQLEPSALREPDRLTAPRTLAANGSHLPATLYHLAMSAARNGGENGHAKETQEAGAKRVYAEIAGRLSGLIDDVRDVYIERDDRRDLLTLMVKVADQTIHPARSLSDGTLRFLGLAVLELDPQAQGVICLEEPENGIHPQRIPAMLDLLQEIVTDSKSPVGEGNPLRQVIVNTHSPAVVAQVPEDALLFADLRETVRDRQRFKALSISAFKDTWRAEQGGEVRFVAPGMLGPYLNPAPADHPSSRRRVADREDLQPFLPFSESA